MGPSRRIGCISDRLPPLGAREPLDDAVPSSVSAIFPLPNGRAQALAAAEKLGTGPVQRYSGLLGSLGDPAE